MIRRFLDLKLRWKLTLPLSLLVVLFCAVAGASLLAMDDLSRQVAVFSHRLLPQATLLLEADRDLHQALLAEREMLQRDDLEAIRASDNERRENFDQARTRLDQAMTLATSPAERAGAERFVTAFAAWRATSDEVATLSRQEDPAAHQRAATLSFGSSRAQFQAAREQIDLLTLEVGRQAEAAVTAADATAQRNTARVASLALIGLVVCLITIALVPALLVKPLHAILARVRDIAEGEGDLTLRIDTAGRDEIGDLGGHVNRLLDRLQTLIRQVGGSTLQLAAAAEQMDTILVDQEQRPPQQHLAVDQVSAAATEMAAAIHEVAGNAQATATSANDANDESRAASQNVEQTMAALRRLATDVEAAATVINRLEASTDQIGTVLSVIQSIAEQTNLLALNAAIEAARAGDQGRGFAVVADEVRALAARTQTSTHDIRAMIQQLQAGTAEAVAVMQRGAALASESVEGAGQTERSLQQTEQSVVRISDMAAQIAAACEEQSLTTGEIARNIAAIGELSSQAADGSRESRSASQEVAQLATALQEQVNRFKV